MSGNGASPAHGSNRAAPSSEGGKAGRTGRGRAGRDGDDDAPGATPAPTSRAVHRPTLLGSALSVAAGLLAVALVADAGPQHQALAVEVVGLAAVAAGIELRHRDHGLVGALVALAGVGVAAVAAFLGSTGAASLGQRLELVPGMVGLVLLVAGVAGLRSRWERHLVTAGTALVLVGVVGSGVSMEADTLTLLAAVVATVVAWDLGEQAINLGEQVGRQAQSRSVEIVHGFGGVVVGAVAVGAALGIEGNAMTGIPLAGLAALLVAALVLMLALYS